MTETAFTFHPATPERWDDVEALCHDSSYPQRCWCSYWYLPNKDFKAGWGEGNRETLRSRVASGRPPGLLAYEGDLPVSWYAMAPRIEHDRLNRSKPFAPVYDHDVCSITCFVVRKGYRRRGLMRQLIGAAVDHAQQQGAQVLEAYPLDRDTGKSAMELYFGSLAAFRDNGFSISHAACPPAPWYSWN